MFLIMEFKVLLGTPTVSKKGVKVHKGGRADPSPFPPFSQATYYLRFLNLS